MLAAELRFDTIDNLPWDKRFCDIIVTAAGQEKVTSLSEWLSNIKDRLLQIAAQAVGTFKEKGKEAMCAAVGVLVNKGLNADGGSFRVVGDLLVRT